jgi:hypothetical protein
MTFTPRLQAFDASVRALRRKLTEAEDDLLEHVDREKRLAAIRDEGDRDLAEKYGI